jgi:hypothetical protein
MCSAHENTRVGEPEWFELVQAIATGDQLALQKLYGRTHRIVFTLIMRIVSNMETAEELNRHAPCPVVI